MKRHYLLCGLFFLVVIGPLVAQTASPNTSPKIFYQETFNWRNSTDPKGWTMPEGYFLEDPNNNGFNWHWWPNDSLLADNVDEPPFQSSTKNDGHLCLFASLYNNHRTPPEYTSIKNSIVFPLIDCSNAESVILQFETNFKNFGYQGTNRGEWQCLVEISVDHGVHWNSFNAGFDCAGTARPNAVAPGQAALFRANISEVAAGCPFVRIKITWNSYFGRYFWIIDDFALISASPNDLTLDYFDIEWDDGLSFTDESVSYMMPLSQLGKNHAFHLFKSGVTNMGETEQTDIVFDVTIKRGNNVVFSDAKSIPSLLPGYKTELAFDSKFSPTEEGNYSIQFKWKQSEEDDTPDDNEKTIYHCVSDTVYNRAGDQPDYCYTGGSGMFIGDSWDLNANLNHFVGTIFPMYGDCEIDGISAYIMGGLADGLIDFGYSMWLAEYYETGTIAPELLLKTDRLTLDSTMFNTWIYLPFTKDGETEFIKTGSVLWAGLEYSNWHTDEVVRRDKGIGLGATNKFPNHDPRTVRYSRGEWTFSASSNLMIRLHLKDPSSSVPDILKANTFALDQNYPNPFTDQTAINYQIGSDSPVKLEITDLTGHKVLVRDEGLKPLGRHQILVEGAVLAPGVYFYTIYAGTKRQTKRMMLMD